MTDLIDRQEAIDVLKERPQANGYSNVALVSELNRSIGYLINLPSVDAVSVVRCVDCVRWNTIFDRTKAEYGLCQIRSQLEATKNDDFCSKGERRTDVTLNRC